MLQVCIRMPPKKTAPKPSRDITVDDFVLSFSDKPVKVKHPERYEIKTISNGYITQHTLVLR